MQRIVILGSTGSVGQSTLDVLAQHEERFSVYGLTANNNVEKMLLQCEQFRPSIAVMGNAEAAKRLEVRLLESGLKDIQVASGNEAITAIAEEQSVDTVMSAIVGAAGLVPTLAAVSSAKKVLIANKEPLVMTGSLFMNEALNSGAKILPIDSEHNAIYQCLPADQNKDNVSRIHLTASGGPFRGREWSELTEITPEQACAHPNWSMGRKISVDSATMMNKGMELIEATALFDLPADRVEVIIHPQSIIHSMVEYVDGSFLAQLGAPDMKIPIAHALACPERFASGAATLDVTEIAQLDFHKPDMANLPCLSLARQAVSSGGSAPAILNAANEIAVDGFLNNQLGFTKIPEVINEVMQELEITEIEGVEHVLQIDNEARQHATHAITSLN